MTNPFEDLSGRYFVLVNHEDQHSLWPSHIDVPPGWTVVYEDDRSACVDYIDEHWTDMRPRSLVEEMSPRVEPS